MTHFSRITRDPSVMSGRACIRDSQVTASTILALLAVGRSHEEVMRMFPTLTNEDFREALAYAAWYLDEQPHPTPEADQPLADQPQFLPESPAESLSISQSEESVPPVAIQPVADETPAVEETLNNGATAVGPTDEEFPEAAPDGDDAVEETLELFHPDCPDQATVVITRHGIYDRRWSTHTIAWCDIREMQRKSSKKTVEILLRNPEFYITSMPFLKRLQAQIKLALNIRTLRLDVASLGVRTRDLYAVATRLWVRHRGRMRFRKKRRTRVNGKSGESRRTVEWDRYDPK